MHLKHEVAMVVERYDRVRISGVLKQRTTRTQPQLRRPRIELGWLITIALRVTGDSEITRREDRHSSGRGKFPTHNSTHKM
jgi:hypothetical protein